MHSSLKQQRLGTVAINHQGLKMEVIEYVNCHHITVRFDDGTIRETAWKEFQNRSVTNYHYKTYYNAPIKSCRLGEEKYNYQGSLMKIINYIDAHNIIVQFNDNPNNTVHAEYQRFKNGNINDPLIPTVYGVGIVGNTAPCMDGMVKRKEYCAWHKIIERCYAYYYKPKYTSYINCSMSDDFLYYPKFFEWIIQEENYDMWKSSKNFDIDKDILCKGNKIYCAEYCCLVPSFINNLIKPRKEQRGKFLIGVTIDPHCPNKYWSQCWNGLLKKNIYLGSYLEEHDAFMAYKDYKEKLIKEYADKAYKDKLISKKCYEALYNYKVEITD